MPYNHARRGYFQWFGQLLSPPNPEGDQYLQDLVESSVSGFLFASEELVAATRTYLRAADHSFRMAALDSLLRQIEGDIAIANLLWAVMEASEENEDLPEEQLTRTYRKVNLNETFQRLFAEIPPHMENVAVYFQTPAGETHRPKDLASAVEDLKNEIEDTTDLIHERSQRIGIRLARSILADQEWSAIQRGINLLQGQQKVGDIGWGLEDEVSLASSGLAGAIRNLLIDALEKILLLVENNDIVRYTIGDWLEELSELDANARNDKLPILLDQLYQTEYFRNKTLPIWLRDALNVERIHRTADQIMQAGDNFDRLAAQIKRIGLVLDSTPIFDHPRLVGAGLALKIGLLSTLVFGGYDSLDEGQRALNVSQGVKEILITTLPVTRQTLTLAVDLQKRVIRD